MRLRSGVTREEENGACVMLETRAREKTYEKKKVDRTTDCVSTSDAFIPDAYVFEISQDA